LMVIGQWSIVISGIVLLDYGAFVIANEVKQSGEFFRIIRLLQGFQPFAMTVWLYYNLNEHYH